MEATSQKGIVKSAIHSRIEAEPRAELALRLRSKVLAPSVPFLDVNRENERLATEIQRALSGVVSSGRFILGPLGEQLENQLAELSGAKYGVACASGSDAILLSLMALGIGSGDEVIVPAFTFFATASAVSRLGATPIFVDIDPKTFQINPSCVQEAITPATRAIIPVHLYGQVVQMEAIQKLAAEYGLSVIEDSAQAIGASSLEGMAGSLGTLSAFSFYPTKNLGGMGDGGLITTSVEALAQKLRLLRGHGMHPRYYHSCIGINSRLDEFQAAVLLAKLPHLEGWLQRRRQIAASYSELLRSVEVASHIELPFTRPGCQHTWHQYTIRVKNGRRDSLRAFLQERNIGSEVYYPVPLHKQECYVGMQGCAQRLPESERAAEEVLSLPIFPTMTSIEQRTVVQGIAEFFGRG
jgi:dTDP-4-amino-4,6-dideoxygalactose transaminase